ncbi:MAG: DUF1972 domain-containing protein [Dysgonomonas sp.]
MKKVAIIGTQGVPAQYGGFETLAEYLIGENCSVDVQYTVFCSGKSYETRLQTYKKAALRYIPLHANGMQSILYDIWSLVHAVRGYDVVMVLGVSGCIFMPVFRLLYRKKIIVNIDGLEYQRVKWGKFVKKFLKLSETLAVRHADVLIADNKGIQDYIRAKYHKEAVLIAYGGDHVQRNVTEEQECRILEKYGLSRHEYALSVCRIEPENNCSLIIGAYAQSDQHLAFVGNWDHSKFGKDLRSECEPYTNIHTFSGIYDLDELYILRKNCRVYIHGHSAGGTNPSLVEAMFFGRPIWAYDVIYNRETTENRIVYFRDISALRDLMETDINHFEGMGEQMLETASRRYHWKLIVKQYEDNYI